MLRVAVASVCFSLVGLGWAAWISTRPFGAGADELLPLAAGAGVIAGGVIWAGAARRPQNLMRGLVTGLVIGVAGHLTFWVLHAGREVLLLGKPIRFMGPPGGPPAGFGDLVAGVMLAIPIGIASALIGWPSVLASGVVGAVLGWLQRRNRKGEPEKADVVD